MSSLEISMHWTSAAELKPKQSKDDGDVSLQPLRSIYIIHLKSLSSVRSDGQICAGAPAAAFKQRSCRVNWGKSCSWNYCIIQWKKSVLKCQMELFMNSWLCAENLQTICSHAPTDATYSGEVCWMLRWYQCFPGWKRPRLTASKLQDEI